MMPTFSFQKLPFLALAFLCFFASNLAAQKSDLVVIRCGAVSKTAPIRNIWLGSDNSKWVASGQNIYRVRACDLATQLPLEPGQRCAYHFMGGNADVSWTAEALKVASKMEFALTAAYYDSKNDALWIGSKTAGVFRFRTQPSLQLIENLTVANSKLKSNEITTIFQDGAGRVWIGTTKGVIIGTSGKWDAELSGYEVQRVRQVGSDIFVMASGELWRVEGGEKFRAIDIPDGAVEEGPYDFDIAPDGKLWLLSRMLTRFDLDSGEFETFSTPEDYTSDYGNCMAIDAEGSVWVGTNDKGLYLVEKSNALTINVLIEKELTCNGPGNDAALRVKVTGGNPPFNFKWSQPTLAGDAPTGLSAGTYTVSVSDKTGKSKSAKVTIESASLRLTATQKKEETAPGAANGAAEVSVAGGVPPYTFAWDDDEKTAQATRLTEGKHSVTATDSKGCRNTASVVISQKINQLAVAIIEKTGNRCAGASEAAITAEVSGGKPPYKYVWDNPLVQGPTPGGLRAAIYGLTVSDAAGQTATASYEVKQPTSLMVLINVDAKASVGKTDGKATASGVGGNGKYSFRWQSGETTQVATQLAAGKNNITMTDGNGCMVISTFDLSENIQPLVAAVVEKTPIKCAGQMGALETSVAGGRPPYKFAWSNAAASGQSPEKLPGGEYSLTITDADGRHAYASASIREPAKISLSAAADGAANQGKNDGKASIRASGGTGKIAYRWDNGETGEKASRLAPGLHGLTVTDANGCTATATVEIPQNIEPLTVAISETKPIKCAGQKEAALSVEVKGGTMPYKFSWSNPAAVGQNPAELPSGTYAVTVLDNENRQATATYQIVQPAPLFISAKTDAPASVNNADGKASARANGGTGKLSFLWDNGETSEKALRLAPGKHSVAASDANGCSASATVEIFENILPLNVNMQQDDDIRCNGGETSITCTVTGGKPPYRYQWNNPAWRGEKPTGVKAGLAQITVTDAAGTVLSTRLDIPQPAVLTILAKMEVAASLGNTDGKASARASGGSGKYDYRWDDGQTGTNANKLAPGQHTVTVTDANGCTANASIEITENIQPLTVSISEKTPIRCPGEKEAALAVTVVGGKPPFVFAWSSAAISGQNPTGVPAGAHTLTVTDAKGASQTATCTIKQPEPIAIEITKNIGATTDRSKDGRAAVAVRGGTGALSIAWDNGETGEKTNRLTFGKHTLTVTDARGCAKTHTFDTPKRILPELNAALLKTGQNVRMEQLQFEADSTNLNASCMPVLNEVYDFLVENGGIVIEIGGHTNSTPPDAYCDKLSSGRAKAVADYLIGRGIDPKRVYSKGYGKRLPVASNSTPDGRKRNQRVEIKILKIE